jgi:alkyldihydroxyacetonephosphate synthase
VCGELSLPELREWVLNRFNVNLTEKNIIKDMPTQYPEPVKCVDFVHALQRKNIDISDRGEDRLMRCHGQTLREMYTLKMNGFKRIPDLIMWPTCHDDVVTIVELANVYDVVIIPYGGGTSVTGAVTCPESETRFIAVLDTSQMNKMLWLDGENLAVCFEAGIVGQDLERELKLMGFTTGHEPDSMEFSTLGGWVATRASGMKKNLYGNIEDLVVRVKMVTSKGVLEKHIPAR